MTKVLEISPDYFIWSVWQQFDWGRELRKVGHTSTLAQAHRNARNFLKRNQNLVFG